MADEKQSFFARMRAKINRPGSWLSYDLANLVERAYVGEGGTTFIHYIGVTSMAEPRLCVPPQYASSRRVQKGPGLPGRGGLVMAWRHREIHIQRHRGTKRLPARAATRRRAA